MRSEHCSFTVTAAPAMRCVAIYRTPLACMVLIWVSAMNAGCAFLAQGGQEVSGIHSARIESILQRGVAKLHSGELDDAEAAFALAIEFGPSAAALDGLGCVALLRGKVSVAEHYFLSALQTDPLYRGALGNLALLYDLQGRPMEAKALYQAAIRAAPGNVGLRNNYAGLLADYEARERAESELRRAATLAAHPIVMGNLERVEAP